MTKPFVRLKEFVLNLLFPVECLGCRRERLWLCPDCLHRLKFNGEEKIHNLKAPALDKIFIAGDYDDALLADLIKKFKYHFLTALGKPLADFLCVYWQGRITLSNLNKEFIITENPLVIPIPLSQKRFRWRGFNQAEILAQEFALNFSYSLSNELKRIKHRPAQASLNEAERLKNMNGVFEYMNNDILDISGRTIILIDDVTTTGSTLNEAAIALRAQGAVRIYGLVLAKG